MSPTYLVVDMDRVLSECEHGRMAEQSLERYLERARTTRAELVARRDKASGPARRTAQTELEGHERRARQEFERRQRSLRDDLVALVTGVVRAVADERGVGLVLERRSALVFDPQADVTDDVLARVDATRVSKPR